MNSLSNVMRDLMSVADRLIRVTQHIEVNKVYEPNFPYPTLVSTKNSWDFERDVANGLRYLRGGRGIDELRERWPQKDQRVYTDDNGGDHSGDIIRCLKALPTKHGDRYSDKRRTTRNRVGSVMKSI
jgi:hypothetical protein